MSRGHSQLSIAPSNVPPRHGQLTMDNGQHPTHNGPLTTDHGPRSMRKWRIMEWLAGRGVRVITRNSPFFDTIPRNVEPEFLAAYGRFGPLSTAPADAGYALWRAVEYVVRCNIPGDFVECGVYRGGSTGLAAAAFAYFTGPPRQFYLYDTF